MVTIYRNYVVLYSLRDVIKEVSTCVYNLWNEKIDCTGICYQEYDNIPWNMLQRPVNYLLFIDQTI